MIKIVQSTNLNYRRKSADGDNRVNSFSFKPAEWEKMQDTVAAYEMQNKFLNKEVLELNQLRQHAIDREQKLFM